jgi:very-short-patch-repair endonuclease
MVSHGSAGFMWMLLRERPRPVEVTVLAAWKPVHPGLRTHISATLSPRDRRWVERIPVTSPARTLLDLAPRYPAGRVERMVADAERRGLMRPSELVEQLARNPRRRGSSTLRTVLGLEGGPAFTRSDAEARLLALVRRAGLPAPETNAMVAGFEVDLLWRRARVVVELDGFAFHGDRMAFEADRLRDAELQARGFRVIRVTWRQLVDDSAGVIDRLSRAIKAALAGRPTRSERPTRANSSQ